MFDAVLEEIGPRLRVRQIIIYTAIIFYRRFYQTWAEHFAIGRGGSCHLTSGLCWCCRQSFVNFDPHLVVGTVFFLASKVEESQLSLTTVASVLHHYTTSTFSSFLPSESTQKDTHLTLCSLAT